jgi:hypothetical protein
LSEAETDIIAHIMLRQLAPTAADIKTPGEILGIDAMIIQNMARTAPDCIT